MVDTMVDATVDAVVDAVVEEPPASITIQMVCKKMLLTAPLPYHACYGLRES